MWAFDNMRSHVDAAGQEWWCIPDDLSDSRADMLRRVADAWDAFNAAEDDWQQEPPPQGLEQP